MLSPWQPERHLQPELQLPMCHPLPPVSSFLPQVTGTLLNCVPPSLCVAWLCLWSRCSCVLQVFLCEFFIFHLTLLWGLVYVVAYSCCKFFVLLYGTLLRTSIYLVSKRLMLGFLAFDVGSDTTSVLGCVHWTYLKSRMSFKLRTDSWRWNVSFNGSGFKHWGLWGYACPKVEKGGKGPQGLIAEGLSVQQLGCMVNSIQERNPTFCSAYLMAML